MAGKLSALATLQAAALECQNDEKEDIEDAMYFAADQIANERGLTSPQRKGKFNPSDAFVDTSNDRLSLNTSGLNRAGSVSPRVDTARSQQLDENLTSLLKDMNFVPKQNLENNLIDDVDKLLELQAVKEGKVEKADLKKKEVEKDKNKLLSSTSRAKDRYLQRLLSSKNKTMGAGHHLNKSHGSGMFIETAPAKVAVLLEMADDKDWSDHLRQSFRTTGEEILFRSMKKVQPVSAKSKSSRPGSSTYTNGSQYSKQKRESRSRDSMSDSVSLSSMDSQQMRDAYDIMRKSTMRLSAPNSYGPSKLDVKIDPTLKYSTYEEARECTFRPTIGKKKKQPQKSSRRDDDSDEEKKEDERYGFLNRQDDQERSRRQQLNDDMGQAEYDALLTKKTCPSCGAKQSYDEMKEKRKMCPNCRVEYKPALSWNTVSKRFFQRDKDYHKKLEEKQKQIEAELADSLNFVERKVVDKETGKVLTIKEPKNKIITTEEEEEFYARLAASKEKSKKNLEQVAKEVYAELTFKPQMKHKKGSDDEADSEEDGDAIFEKFIKRVDEDMEYRREILPTKYLPIRKYNPDDDLEPFRI